MASLQNNILGIITGKIGNIVAKKFNGKQIIAARPRKYRMSNSMQACSERSKFSRVVDFAKYINSIPDLKSIWNQSGIQGFSAYHKIIKTNLLLTSGNQLGSMNIIVPPSEDFLNVNYIFKSNGIGCEVLQFPNIHSENAPEYFTLQFVFAFSESTNRRDKVFNFIGCSYSLSRQELNNNSKINICLSEEIKTATLNYRKCILYSAVFWHEKITYKYQWSSISAQTLY